MILKRWVVNIFLFLVMEKYFQRPFLFSSTSPAFFSTLRCLETLYCGSSKASTISQTQIDSLLEMSRERIRTLVSSLRALNVSTNCSILCMYGCVIMYIIYHKRIKSKVLISKLLTFGSNRWFPLNSIPKRSINFIPILNNCDFGCEFSVFLHSNRTINEINPSEKN